MRDHRPNRLFLRFREEGDTRALGELFDLLSPELLRVARHVARDAAEAEDLVQATFLTALEHPERFDASRPLTAWLVGVLTLEARAWGRGAARRPDGERALEEQQAREARERPELLAAGSESRGLLESALERLPARYQGVLAAHLLRSQSPTEIAHERQASASTVRVQLHRGLAQLRQLLPAGMAGGLVLTLAPRGSAALRAELLSSAQRLTPAAKLATVGAGAAITTKLGSLIMLQRLGLGALCVLVVIGLVKLPALLAVAGSDGSAQTALGPDLRVVEHPELVQDADAATDTNTREALETTTIAAAQLRLGMRVLTRWADGTPAPQIGFQYINFAVDSEPAFARSDEQGVVILEDLAPGQYMLYGDRGGHAQGSVRNIRFDAETVTPEQAKRSQQRALNEVVLQLEPGVDVRGRVVDKQGRGVANAQLWITNILTRDTGLDVGRSAADGSFLVRQLTEDCFIGARTDSHAPSRPEHVQYWLERRSDSGALTLILRLGETAARVSGVVLDPDGRPVAGARVRIGAQEFFESFGPTGVAGPPPPLRRLTNERGEFKAAGLAPGRIDIACQSAGYPVATATVTVPSNGDGRASLRLEDPAWVRGRVTSTGGSALAGVWISAHRNRSNYDEGRSSFAEPRVQTDRSGDFVIGPIASGAVSLWATTADRKTTAQTRLNATPGVTYEWTPQLEGLPVIRGIARDANGKPLDGWTVVAKKEGLAGPPPSSARTATDGRFELRFSFEGSVHLELHGPREAASQRRTWIGDTVPRAWLAGVVIGTRDVQLVLDPAQAPTASLRAELATTTGDATPRVLATLVHERFGELLREELPAGSTELVFDGLPAGSLTLTLEGAHLALLRRDGIELEQGASLDLGLLQLNPGGALFVDLTRADGQPIEHLDVRLTDGAGRQWWLGEVPGGLERQDLPAGEYRLRLHAQDCGPRLRTVRIVAGQRTEEHVRLAPGGSLGIVLLGEGERPLAEGATLRVETAAGELVLEETLEPNAAGHVSRWFFAPLGDLDVTATARDGRRVEVRLRLAADEPGSTPRPLILR